MEIKSENMAIQQPTALMPSGLTGEIKNMDGEIDREFLEAVEKLMTNHRVNYIQLYWARFGNCQ